jgi:hypothetical protein
MYPMRHTIYFSIALAMLSLATVLPSTSWAGTTHASAKTAPATKAAREPAPPVETVSSKADSKQTTASNPSDIRVLIDISGSMKKNDPQNLRAPAIKLLSQLIPENSKAGLWTFGQGINELVPLGKVNPAWRKKALDKVSSISSDGIYTNIGLAMDRASDDFSKLPTDHHTSVILLTDGMIDVSRNPDENTVEKNRVLSTVLARYKQANVPVHTIALSEQSDQELMRALASNTDGLALQADTAEQLLNLFNQLLRQETKPEQLPLDGNIFLVDSSIDEFTLLAIHHPESAPTQLESPDKNRYSAKSSDPYINWHVDDRYDLITVKQPLEGEWKLIAAKNPNNQVTIISNLKVELAPMANNYNVGDTPDIDVRFSQNGKPIEDAEFFKLLTVDVEVTNISNRQGWKSGIPEKNQQFKQALQALPEPGDYRISILVDGKTFERKLEHSLRVNANTKTPDPAHEEATAPAVPAPEAQAAAAATHHSETAAPPSDDHTPHAEEAKDKHGTTPEAAKKPEQEKPETEKHAEPVKPDEHAAKDEHATEDEHAAEKTEHEPPKKTPWWVYVAIGVANLLLAGIGYFAWRFLMGNKKSEEDVAGEQEKPEKPAKH